ncbi:uncharacterized protein K460DRAFT_314583 [Cucurbitaria berberidis CBS 394.84]|uniref:Aminoglycoside phosphotransferase domain-containing protein n=1 Tax=Cucurbitaria berberidis CBS 394.84 TaxID=1168544 RepID=A0A9P4L630_9PLEO|nr:uncharacterized protein K460DRAFT_314583 [Cucurbitaria berberidis CBS 394.84]KAF1842869.1 hypothetical protein K460DRAFT_314583 [Cucurbitaria berberidis CBS 394.84]
MTATPEVSFADLPDASQTQMDFQDSTWFKTHGLTRSLPSPEDVRARCPAPTLDNPKPIVRYEELDLLVKFGDRVRVSEAVCLRAIKQLFGNQVPVPEIYGWRVEGQHVFIYMQLIHGPTLLERWATMSYEDRQSVCSHLHVILHYLRLTKQDSSNEFIGQFLGGPSKDRILDFQPSPGPWKSAASFHDWLSWLWRRRAPEPDQIADPWRQMLDDKSDIVLTHGDLHRSNIIVSATSPVYVVAIVDWEQSGWYPDYWEYCKTMYTVPYHEDWRSAGWIDSILTPQPAAQEAFDYYTEALGL